MVGIIAGLCQGTKDDVVQSGYAKALSNRLFLDFNDAEHALAQRSMDFTKITYPDCELYSSFICVEKQLL